MTSDGKSDGDSKRLEYELMKSRLVMSGLGIAMWDMEVVSVDHTNPRNVFKWSQEFRRLLGFESVADFPDVLSSWSSRLHPDDSERVLRQFAAHISDKTGRTSYNLEYRLKTKGGEYRSFRAIGITIRDGDGSPLSVAGSLEDITERVRQQEMLENIFNAMDSHIYVTDLETDEILFANNKLKADFRLTDDVKGDKCWRHLQKAQTGRCSFCHKPALSIDNDASFTWEEDNAVTNRSLYKIDRVIDWPGGRKVHMQQCMDITPMKQAQKTLAKREKMLDTLNRVAIILLSRTHEGFADAMGEGVSLISEIADFDRMSVMRNVKKPDGLYVSQSYRWSRNSGGTTDILAVLTDVSYADLVPLWEAELSSGGYINGPVSQMHQTENIRRFGCVSVLAMPVFTGGEFWGFVVFENLRAEREFTGHEVDILRSASFMLVNVIISHEEGLRLRAADEEARLMLDKLEAAVEEAHSANNAKSNFLASMSHEIRTPLNAVVGFSMLALDNTNLDADAKDKLEKIHTSGMTILSIVNDILDISKIESGKYELFPVQYDTPSLINDVITLNIMRIGEKPVEFILDVNEDLPSLLYGDDLRVKQVFNNVLSNAFKYTNRGQVKWSITFEKDGNDCWLISTVSDTGIGIKPEGLTKLFTDYNQADIKTNRKLEGTGLGLAIAKKLVEMMDGSISVTSEYGRGTVFNIRIKQRSYTDGTIGSAVAENLRALHYAADKVKTRIARSDMSYARVLVVDDITANLDVVKGMMKPYGIKIDCVLSGRQAIELIRAGQPHYSAIFMDHMMPEMDGIEATQIIRSLDSDYARGIPIIALTANAIVGNEEMFLGNGFQAFISKPIEIARLDAVLNHYVRDKNKEQTQITKNEAGGTVELNIPGIDLTGALERFSGDIETLTAVLHSYKANTRQLLEQLDAALARGDCGEYAIAVHGLKGASYNVMAGQVGKLAEELELLARAGNADGLKAGHVNLSRVVKKLLTQMDEALTASKKTLLIANTSGAKLRSLKAKFEGRYNVLLANSASMLTKCLATNRPDLILLDGGIELGAEAEGIEVINSKSEINIPEAVDAFFTSVKRGY
jgi:PAS domain S-box-containing protein